MAKRKTHDRSGLSDIERDTLDFVNSITDEEAEAEEAARIRAKIKNRRMKQRREARRRKQRLRRIYLTILAIVALLLILGIAGIVHAIGKAISNRKAKNQAAADTEAVYEVNDAEIGVNTETDTEAAEIVVEEPVHADDGTIDLVFVGDILLHDPVEKYALQEDGSYDFSSLFANTLEDIEEADLAIVNQEVVIGGEELGVSGYPTFNAPYEMADCLAQTGFDVVLAANNHSWDKYSTGVKNELAYFDSHYPNMEVLGIHDSEADADEIYVYEQNGIRIAILNYTYGSNAVVDADYSYMLDTLTESEVRADIQAANELADLVIVCPHWGTEYSLEVDSTQKNWCQIFLEEGVDLVVGGHAHVIEPVQIYTNETTGDQMIVYYSLGNFVNWTSSSGSGIANRNIGGMAKVSIGYDTSGNPKILNYGVTALVCHDVSETNGITVYKLADYTEELAEANEIKSQDSAFTLEYAIDLCDQIWGSLWE